MCYVFEVISDFSMISYTIGHSNIAINRLENNASDVTDQFPDLDFVFDSQTEFFAHVLHLSPFSGLEVPLGVAV